MCYLLPSLPRLKGDLTLSAPLCLLQDSDITPLLKCIESSDLPEDSPCLWSVPVSARHADHIQTYRVTTGAVHVKLWGMLFPVLPAQHPFILIDPDTGTSCLPSPTWSVGCQGQHRHSLQWHTSLAQCWECTQKPLSLSQLIAEEPWQHLPLCEAAPPSSCWVSA